MSESLLTDIAQGLSDKGPVRSANEDSFILPDTNAPTELGLIYVVADGVGGLENGAEASQLAVRIIHDVFYQTRQVGESIPVALAHAADQANLAIYDESQRRQAGRMGCTVVTAVHHQGQRYLLHAGDARAYLLRDGHLQKLTRDDTWVQRQVEEGIIEEDTAQHHELRHVVTRVLGNNPTAEFTVSEPTAMAPGDVLMLCSDGLHDVVGDSQIQQILADNSPAHAAETLLATAVQNKSQDNITAIVIHSMAETAGEATLPMQNPAAAPAPETIAMTAAIPAPELPEAPILSRRKPGIRLPLWALASLAVAVIAAVIYGSVTLFQRLRSDESPAATELLIEATPAAPTSAPTSTTEAPAALPTIMETAVPPPTLTPPPPTPEPGVTEISVTETAVPNLACIVNPGAFTFVWQETQLLNESCNQFAQSSLNDGDAVIILDATPRSALGPDQFCQANEFIEIQSAVDTAVTGWVLVNNVQITTPEQGCPP
jgi:protein phosphatase